MWIKVSEQMPEIGQRVVTDGFVFATWSGKEWVEDSGEIKPKGEFRLWMDVPNPKHKQIELDDVPF